MDTGVFGQPPMYNRWLVHGVAADTSVSALPARTAEVGQSPEIYAPTSFASPVNCPNLTDCSSDTRQKYLLRFLLL